ncbi:Uma2 family endonuclease [Micromonospora sp. NPDC048169]|uniref:Uma2 family endonuclease n=1 Tax=unclassified Micromonospora TaxID=2617518 RepID=UPI0033FCAC0C
MSVGPAPTSAFPWRPDPIRQLLTDYRLDDLLTLPPEAPSVELVDGIIHLTPFPTLGHQGIASLLAIWLRSRVPAHLRAAQAVSIGLDVDSSRRPDVLLHHAGLPSDRSLLRPADVVLAVEIVSPGTRRVDRFAKPGEYAAARIPFYWRIEQDPVHLYAYRLGDRIGPGGERQYELVDDSSEVIELSEPFAIKLPIAEIRP